MKTFPYSWNHYEEYGSTKIRIFGLSELNESIYIKIEDFLPYIYIELPNNLTWTPVSLNIVQNKLKEVSNNSIVQMEAVQKKKLYFAKKEKKGDDYIDKTYPFIKCSFKTVTNIRQFIYKIKNPLFFGGVGKIQLKTHETDANPILQFLCAMNIKPANWFTFRGKKIVKEDDKEGLCDHEFLSSFRTFQPIEESIPPARPYIMCFDIEVNSSNPNVFPNASQPGDKVFQISCVFGRNGETEEKFDKYILTLCKNKIGEYVDLNMDKLGPGIEVLGYETESDLLEGFKDMVIEKNPQIICGYNIFSFDITYMHERSKICNIERQFCQLSCIRGMSCQTKEINWSSSAFKNQNFKYIDAHGRLWIDMLPIIQRDYKLDNYKLKTVSDQFLSATKDPLTPKGIFKCYRMFTSDSLSICAKYCVQDSNLVLKLFEKLQIWIGLCEMSNTCNTPIFTLFTQGQQIKIFSQVYKKCLSDGIVIDKDSFVTNEDDRFTGAYVFPPVPGLYEMVVSFDFSSLYPSTMIAYNIDYSTLVIDDTIPDEKCHVIEWSDHIGCCISEGSAVSLSCLSTSIENLVKNKDDVLSWSYQQNGTIYSKQTRFYDQGYKDCIELTFEDGRTLTCTPDHKLLRSDGSWIQASDFQLDKDRVMISILYPLYNESDDILDCNGWHYTIKTDFDELSKCLKGRSLQCLKDKSILSSILATNSSIEFNKTMIISRLCGLLITDGHIDKFNNCCFFCGHIMDVEMLQNDIYKICGRNLSANKGKSCWSIRAPIELSYLLSNIGNVQKGKKMKQKHLLPEFINENCPKPILREFLGGLFGGDGCTISLNKNKESISGISFIKSSDQENIESLKQMLIVLQTILKNCFDINSTINFYLKLGQLLISLSDTVKFSEKIGFRYCVHKTQRLNATVSYINLRDKIGEQFNKVVEYTKSISINENIPISKAVEIAHKKMKDTETILNKYYSLPNYQCIIDRLKKTSKFSNKKISFRKDHFPGITKYLELIGAIDFFDGYGVKFEDNALPVFYLRILSIKKVGIKKVYDIEVENTHNFVVNGIIVHNCHDTTVRKTKVKDIICAKQRHRFLKEPLGVIPTLLKNLLDARKKTNAEMKKMIKEVEDMKDTSSVEYEDKKRMITVLDKRQLSYKVSCNSMYGGYGVRRGYLPFMTGAMCVTAKGRQSIEKAAKFLVENFGAKLIYGDSVSGDTPILVRYENQSVDILRIDEMGEVWNPYEVFKKQDSNRFEKQQTLPFLSSGKKRIMNIIEVWTGECWSRVRRVIRHKTVKKMYRVETPTGCVDVTEDHSLLDQYKQKVKPTELTIGSQLYHSFPPVEDFLEIEFKDVVIEGKVYQCTQCHEYKLEFEFRNTICKMCLQVNDIDETEYYRDLGKGLDKKLAYVWGIFMSSGYCDETCWYIKHKHLETCKSILEIYEPLFQWSIQSYSVCPLDHISIISNKWKRLFYDRDGNKKVPYFIMNSSDELKYAFLNGYIGDKNQFVCQSKIGAQGLYTLLHSLGHYVELKWSDEYIITTCNEYNQPNSVVSITSLPDSGYDEYVYDIETESGMFMGGVGRLVLKNTDSCYINFPEYEDSSKAKELDTFCRQVESDVSSIFPKPMKFAYEEQIYWRYLILTKKRYMALKCDLDGNVDNKIAKRGVLLSRRDNSKYIRDTYSELILKSFYRESIDTILHQLYNNVKNICIHHIAIKDLVVTKSIGDLKDYKIRPLPIDDKKCKKRLQELSIYDDVNMDILRNIITRFGNKEDIDDDIAKHNLEYLAFKEYVKVSLPAQVQLAERMRSRGSHVSAGERLGYVITQNGDKLSEKMEDLDYFKEHSEILRIDYLYYIKLMINPIDEVLTTVYGEKDLFKKFYKTREQYKKVITQLENLFRPQLRFVA